MNYLRTILQLLMPLGFLRLQIFGSSKSTSNSSTRIHTHDNRAVTESGQVLAGNSINAGGGSVSINSPDAVKAIAQLGADAIARTGDSVVKINEQALAGSATAWDKTVTSSAALVDKLIDATTTLGTTFQPIDNKQQDTVRTGLIAGAAALVAYAFLKARK